VQCCGVCSPRGRGFAFAAARRRADGGFGWDEAGVVGTDVVVSGHSMDNAGLDVVRPVAEDRHELEEWWGVAEGNS
jgi:hypothetical protein